MRFLTTEETKAWCTGDPPLLGKEKAPLRWPAPLKVLKFSYAGEPAGRLYWLSQQLVAALDHWDEALLWVVESGIWGSSENLHLYYRVRQSYGDLRHLNEAPGHLLLRHEREDATTLLNLCMIFGWGAFMFTSHDYGRLFVSHDEYCELAASDGVDVGAIRRNLESGDVTIESWRPTV